MVKCDTAVVRASGGRFDRADRLLVGYEDMVEGFGKRRGKRHRLTAAGHEHCARLVRSLVELATVAPAGSRRPPGQAGSVRRWCRAGGSKLTPLAG